MSRMPSATGYREIVHGVAGKPDKVANCPVSRHICPCGLAADGGTRLIRYHY